MIIISIDNKKAKCGRYFSTLRLHPFTTLNKSTKAIARKKLKGKKMCNYHSLNLFENSYDY